MEENDTSGRNWGTVDEAAALRGVSRDTIRRMIERGEVYGERFGPRLIKVDLNTVKGQALGTEEAGQPTAAEQAAKAYQAGYESHSSGDDPGSIQDRATWAARDAGQRGPAGKAYAAMYVWGWVSAEADAEEGGEA